MPTPLTDHVSLEALTGVGPHADIDNTPPDDIAANLLTVAEKIEQALVIWGVPVRESYGYRCPALNAAVGGSATSAHMFGLAADCVPEGMDLRVAWDMLRADPTFMEDVDQLIIERGCVHIGLPIAAHNFVARHELRLDATVDGVRTYPLWAIWPATGVQS